ncbi:hypothetical protein I1A62_37045 [Rhodococcus sp. USK10]|uniref:hypothetical protein n=1 Tax=Rhodococcus sp. USK10 TaxID=2789739 RepID=UPI001C5F5DC3|nr:hypothetical protein [Rhodococcus sp. USK10]QYB02742.1 hypothetical protein I1A62_37045 [Rhodococcus sp. USK10]
MAAIAIYVAVAPIASTVGKSIIIGLAALFILAAVLLFPYKSGSGAGGVAGRLANHLRVNGDKNQVQIAGDEAQLNQAGRDIRDGRQSSAR